MDGVHSLLFESFSDAPPAWRELCRDGDLAMDLRVLSVSQRTLRNQCRCWGVVVFNAAGAAIGCAALCAFPVGLLRVLFCGLPVPAGSTHLRFRDTACAGPVLHEVACVMHRLALSIKCRLIVFKEFDDASAAPVAGLSGMGFVHGEIPPLHVLNVSFASFAEYRQALKNRYRSQVWRSQQKMQAAGFEVLSGRGSAFFARHFDENVYRLYVAVWQRARHKLELLPAAFFQEMASELGDEVSLTLIRRQGRILAFTFAITRGDTHYNLYSGLDYAVNHEGDLYFNLFYHDMDQAFRAGATRLHLGQTSDTFKSRLGTRAERLYFFVRAPSPALNLALRFFSPIASPKVAAVRSHDVFARAPKI